MLRISDARNFGRTLAGIGLIVGPILLVISNIVAPAWAHDTPEYLQEVAENEGAHLAAALIAALGALFLIPGLIGVIHLLRGRRVGVGQIGAALFAVGMVMSVGLFVFAVMDIGMVDPGADRTQMIGLSDRVEESVAAAIFFLLYLMGFVLGGILLAIGLWRRRAVPAWVPIMLLAASVLGVFETAVEQVLLVTAYSLLAMALGAIGIKLLSLSDEKWGHWQVLPDRAEPEEGAMKRVTLGIIAAGAAITSAALVGSSGAQQLGPATRSLELVTLDRETRFTFVDNPPRRREARGDLFMIVGRLRDVSNRPAGQVHGSFAETKAPPRYVQQGSATFILRNGRIMVTGALDSRGRNDRTDTLAVVGGSGAYAGARGTVVSTARPKSQRFVFTFAS